LRDLEQSVRIRRPAATRKYLYGVINCGSLRSLELTGIDGATVYCRPHKSIGAAVSDVDCADCLRDISAIAHHEGMIESLMEQYSLLPARFGTVMPDQHGIDDLLRENYASFCCDLQRLENKVQFDLSVLWPAYELRVAIEQNEAPLGEVARLGKTGDPGARYAVYKQREKAILRVLERKAAEHADEVQSSLLCLCGESRCETLPSEGVMLRGYYLIDRTLCDELRNTIDTLQARAPRFTFLLTGPWPPYSFMNLEERILKCEVV